MMLRTVAFAIASTALLAPAAASATSVRIEGFYGYEQPPSSSFSSAASGAQASDLYKDGLQLAGADVLVNLGGLELGAIIDTTFGNNQPSQTALGGLAGVGLELGPAKLDLLGEVGGHRYGNFANNPDIVTSSTSSQWLAYVGLRPGVTFQLGGPISLGIWAFVRWDVTTHDIPVTVGSASSSGSYSLGGTTVGAAVRLGFDL